MFFYSPPAALFAQSFWLERNTEKTFALELYNPVLSGLRSVSYQGESYPVDYSFNTFALFLSTRLPLAKNKFLVTELPFAHAEFDTKIERDFSFFRNSGRESTIGNPYLGLELGSLASQFFTEIGIRLPLTHEENTYAAYVGRASQYDRPEAFELLASLRAMFNYRAKRTRGLTFRARAGVVVQRDFDHLGDHYFSTPLDAQVGYGYETGRFRLEGNLYIRIDGGYRHIKSRLFSSQSYRLSQKQRLGLAGSVGFGSLRLGASFPGLFSDSERASSIPDFGLLGFNLSLQQ